MPKNYLSSEKSPYLKQHANNPVWWYAWGDEAFAAAKAQDKPIFLSIGYATCYWCHVMEKDSFETEEVAKVLNDLFISIKVDREERPDVDKIYMDTVVALTGHGGWPLSVALTPDLKPYWAGTFFYKEQFIQILRALARAWKDDQAKVIESASEITQEIFKENEKSHTTELNRNVIIQAVSALSSGFDSQYGGFGSAPKFPPPFQLALLLRFARSTQESQHLSHVKNMITVTLDNMIRSGIYDQIGGGFHRYATDQKWLVPHFEKMLYDNAQLCHLLSEAYQFTKEESYLIAAKGTADYVIRDLLAPLGGFYAAEDAGEVGREGEFYVFQYKELQEALSEKDFSLLQVVYDISEAGNFEHGNNIFSLKPNLSLNLWKESEELRTTLLKMRDKRERPLTDTKILCSWNALMIRALVKLYEVSLDKKYLSAASNAANFILNNLWKSKKLYRRFAEAEAGISACLEDYAFLVEALLDLFSMSGKQEWFDAALQIQKAQDSLLWNDAVGLYYDSAAVELISRKVDLTDGATPAGNSVAAKNLIILARMTANPNLLNQAQRILLNFSGSFENYPHAACRALQALDLFTSKSSEIVLSGTDLEQCAAIEGVLAQQFLPTSVQVRINQNSYNNELLKPLLTNKSQDKEVRLYLCSGHSCNLPLKSNEVTTESFASIH